MGVALSPGHPNYSGTFIPELWAGELLVKFYDASVLTAISNTQYEGEIKKFGDVVHVNTLPDITIRDYSKGQTLIIQRPDTTQVDLEIDKAKYWNAIVDDIDKVQSKYPLLSKWAQDASEQMKIAVDTDVLANLSTDIVAANKGITAGSVSGDIDLGTTADSVQLDKTNILEKIIDMGLVLDEQNVPETDRWLVMPAWAIALLKKSDIKDASMTGDSVSVLRNGRVGRIDRFTIYSSNLLPTASDTYTCYYVYAGHPVGLTFASQIVETETLRAESTFGNLMRGLKVYGYKVMKGEALVELYCRK